MADLIKKIGAVFSVKVVGALLAFIGQLLFARTLGVEQFGYYSFVISGLLISMLVVRFGYTSVLTRFVSKYKVETEWGKIAGLRKFSRLRIIRNALIMAIVSLGLLFIFKAHISQTEFISFLIALIALPLVGLMGLTQGTLQGLHLVALAHIPEKILKPAFEISLILILTYFWGLKINAIYATTLTVFSIALAMTIAIMLEINRTEKLLVKSPPSIDRQLWVSASISMFYISGIELMMRYVDIFILGLMSTAVEVGVYSATAKLTEFVSFGLIIANAIFAPKISELHAQDKIDELQILVKKVTLIVSVLAFFNLLVLLFLGKNLLSIYGDEFIAGYTVLLILAVGQLINALTGPVGILMMMTGHEKKAAAIYAKVIVVNVIANIILIKFFGMHGAAIATAMAYVMKNLMMMKQVKTHLGITTFLGLMR